LSIIATAWSSSRPSAIAFVGSRAAAAAAAVVSATGPSSVAVVAVAVAVAASTAGIAADVAAVADAG